MEDRHRDVHKGNWQEFLRQKLKDWRTYPQLSEEQFRGISCPTLFIAGQHDPYAPEEDVMKVTTLIPNSRYVIIEGASHRPHMIREQPIFVNDTILSFLEEVGRANEQASVVCHT